MNLQDQLENTISKLTAPGKGLLAADESTATITKRLSAVGVESTEENRRQYRSLILSAPGLGESISGVILYEETLSQRDDNGTPLPQVAAHQGIVPGIKVDKGKGPMPNAPGDEITSGLDGLEERLEHYRELGARFAKWRSVYHIAEHNPGAAAIEANAEVLARYAAICQCQGVVPIVEPEVLINGSHGIDRCAEVSEAVIRAVFNALYRHGVQLETMILKPSMITPGQEHSRQASPEEVAEFTLRTFRRCVPAAVPVIHFLSGGQTPEEATLNLNAINQMAQPWTLGFSYGRALQEPAQKAWAGHAENWQAAQTALLKRARLNSRACLGEYQPTMEAA
ncbi:class I fructose-bisphosphate aldolase [Marinobacter lacisalsi]|uniref:fructose-bisphosphate aldolase n=1 Tax=Marinobacter lacisalsi TaxID=475979 RepID=A0ABV8QGW7_9GAMM